MTFILIMTVKIFEIIEFNKNQIAKGATNIINSFRKKPDDAKIHLVIEYLTKLEKSNVLKEIFDTEETIKNSILSKQKSHDKLFLVFLEKEIRYFCEKSTNYKITKNFVNQFKNVSIENYQPKSKTFSKDLYRD